MATKTVFLPYFKKGLWMGWDMHTQAAYDIHVTLKDDSKPYVNDAHKASLEYMPALSTGYDQIKGDNLQLIINIPQAIDIKTRIYSYMILKDDGSVAGYAFDLFAEDATDQDYNDLQIRMVAWISNV